MAKQQTLRPFNRYVRPCRKLYRDYRDQTAKSNYAYLIPLSTNETIPIVIDNDLDINGVINETVQYVLVETTGQPIRIVSWETHLQQSITKVSNRLFKHNVI